MLIATCLGWIVVFSLLLWFKPGVGAWLCVLLCAVPTAFLFHDVRFPRRRLGLAYSWIGAALTTVMFIVYALGKDVPLGAMTGSRAFIKYTDLFLGGMVLLGTLIVIWYQRMYGLLPALSMVASLGSRDHREKVEERARAYPQPRWWIPPFLFLLCWSVLLVLVDVVVARR